MLNLSEYIHLSPGQMTEALKPSGAFEGPHQWKIKKGRLGSYVAWHQWLTLNMNSSICHFYLQTRLKHLLFEVVRVKRPLALKWQ